MPFDKLIIKKQSGFLRQGTIIKYNEASLTVDVQLGYPNSEGIVEDGQNTITAQLPLSYYNVSSGGFISGYPAEGTPVIVAQGEANIYYIVSFLARSPALNSTTSLSDFFNLDPGSIRIQSNTSNSILLSDSVIKLGNNYDNFLVNTSKSFIFSNYDQKLSLTEASREIEGVVRREKKLNVNYPDYLRLEDIDYNDVMIEIGLDPTISKNISNLGGAIRNPPLVEKREIVYEFAHSYNVLADRDELKSYKDKTNNILDLTFNRRESRSDTLSLSLEAPNYLIETVKGTVVDIFGNILDINRYPILIGKDNVNTDLSRVKDNTTNNIFQTIKQLERKSIAFHFEINVKKDLSHIGNNLSPPDINNTENYSRSRSRFYLDIDKEGQIKLNVPASSETGNISLLTRYENYSTINKINNSALETNYGNKDKKDNIDILLDNFIGSNGVIEVLSDNNQGTPLDRITKEHIKHGTVYHNILNTCLSHQNNANYILEYMNVSGLALGRVEDKKNIVNPIIHMFGKKANAGGRSGSFNFDGSLELNIGANTVDRQSLWMDLQGGSVINMGRDISNNISMALNCDGEILIQSGGTTPGIDSRYADQTWDVQTTRFKSGVIDVRVLGEDNKATVIRIDKEGITLTTPGRMVFSSNQNMSFRSNSRIDIVAPVINIQDRTVIKGPSPGPIS